MIRVLVLLLLCLSAFAAPVQAQLADRRPIEFRDSLEEKRFRSLTHELRCVMCQNQSLADSDAQIAVDLRREIITLLREGRSDQEIRDFLVARYGEFVLYRPGISPATYLLWFGPLLILAAGGWTLWRTAKAHAKAKSADDTPGDW